METIMFIFRLAVCIFEIWIIFDFFDAFLGSKLYKAKDKIIAIISFSLMVFLINSFENTILNLILVPVIYLISAVLFFEGNILKKIFASLIGTGLLFGIELIAVSALSLTSKELIQNSIVNEPSAVFLIIIIKMLSFVVFAIIKQLIPKKNDNMDFVTFLLFMVAPLSGLGIMFSLVFCDINFTKGSPAKYVLLLFCFLLLIGDVAVFYGYIRYAKMLEEKKKNSEMLLEQKMQLDNYKSIDLANDKYLKLLHDANHQITTIYRLLLKEKKEEATAVLQSLVNQYEQIKFIEYSSNAILNTILSDYKEKSEKEKIEFDVFVEQGFNINYVEEIDIVALIGNLLSNAYEATKKAERRKIKVQMFMQNDGSFSVIKIQNSFNGMVEIDGERLSTMKTNKQQHGYGIKIAEEAAEKYNGWISRTWDESIFKTVLVLENK